MAADATVSVVVKQALSGDTISTLTVDKNQKVIDIKVALEASSKTPAKYQKLLLPDAPQELQDDQTLSSAGFQAGGHLTLVICEVNKLDFVSAVHDGIKEINLLRYMLANGADINGKLDGKGRPPSLDDGIEQAQDKHLLSVAMNEASALHHASNHGHLEVCRLILESKEPSFTEINSLTTAKGVYDDDINMSALHVAALNGHSDVCCLLLSDKRFELIDETFNEPNASRDALALACQKGLPRVVEMLLKDSRCTGINREIDSYDTTLLHLAACNNTPGNIEICKMIINDSRFTDYEASTCRGAGTKLSGTALEIAKANGLDEVVTLLESK